MVEPADFRIRADQDPEQRGDLPARADQPLAGRDDGAEGAVPARIQYCEYCGAQVDPRAYFCMRCATPYKSPETVLTPARPLQMTDGLRIERMAPQVAPLFWTYLAVAIVAGVVSYALFAVEEMPHIALIVTTAAVFATTGIFATIHWPSLAAQFKRVGFLNGYAWIGLAALAPLLGLNYSYHLLLTELGVKNVMPMEKLHELMGTSSLVLLVCVAPAVSEEIAFRGLVQHWLQVAVRPVRAVVIASALFTVLHFTVLSAPYLFLVGFLLGYVKLKTGSLYPSMLIHFLHNLFVVLLFRF